MGGAGHRGAAAADVDTGLPGGVFVKSAGADLGVGERHPRQRPAVRRWAVLTEVPGSRSRPGTSRRGARDIPDAPNAVGHPAVVVDCNARAGDVDADGSAPMAVAALLGRAYARYQTAPEATQLR